MSMTLIPGTVIPKADCERYTFSMFDTMISTTGGLALSQICSITGLEGSTIQNWIKRGWVAKPVSKRYFQRQLARIIIINALRNCMQLEQIVNLLAYLNGSVEDESDDIISEADLFDDFCYIVFTTDFTKGFSRKSLQNSIKPIVAEYKERHTDSRVKLENGLLLMLESYIAGQIKQQVELLYKELIQ